MAQPGTYQTSYVVFQRGQHQLLAIFETPDGDYRGTLDYLDRRTDGWVEKEAKTVYTDLERYPDIIPQYSI